MSLSVHVLVEKGIVSVDYTVDVLPCATGMDNSRSVCDQKVWICTVKVLQHSIDPVNIRVKGINADTIIYCVNFVPTTGRIIQS